MPASVRDAVLARTAGLVPEVRRCLELLSCTPEPVSPELAGRARGADGDRQPAGCHRLHRPARPGRRVPPRDRAVRDPPRGRARFRAGAAHSDDRGAGGGRRRPERAGPPRRGGGRCAPGAPVRARRCDRGFPLRGAPGGRRVLRGGATWGTTPPPAPACSRPCRRSCTSPTASTRPSRPGSGRGAASRAGRGRRGRRRAHGTLRLRLVRGRSRLRHAARPSRHGDPLVRDDQRALGFALARHTFLAAWGATPRRRVGRATGPHGSPTIWVATSCCAAPRRSGSRWRGCSRATWPAGPTSSRPPRSACGIGSTTWQPRR